MRNEEGRLKGRSHNPAERDPDMDGSKLGGESFDREGRFKDQDREFDSSYYNHRQERWTNNDRNQGEWDRKRETTSPDSNLYRGSRSDYSGMGRSYDSMTTGSGRDDSFFGGSQSSFQGDGWSGSNSQGRTHFGKGPKGWKRSDERIREEACEALYHAHSVDASEIEVMVKDACVSLKGTVESREAKREAERVIESISAIDDVHNELRVSRGMENSPTMNSSLSGTSSSHSNSSKLS